MRDSSICRVAGPARGTIVPDGVSLIPEATTPHVYSEVLYLGLRFILFWRPSVAHLGIRAAFGGAMGRFAVVASRGEAVRMAGGFAGCPARTGTATLLNRTAGPMAAADLRK